MRLVDFFIVGAMRSGTSTLTQSLRMHPKIFMLRNEPKFFIQWDGSDLASLDDYHSMFNWDPCFEIRGEKSAPYGPSRRARDGILGYNQNAKIIWLFRDPVKRAVSHFYRALDGAGEKSVSLERAIVKKDALEKANSMYAYVYRSEYFKQLMMWLEVFPDSQIHTSIFEEMLQNPKRELDRICDFLGVEPLGEIYPKQSQTKSKATSKGLEVAPIKTETLDALYDALTPDMEAFFDHIGRRISAWQR